MLEGFTKILISKIPVLSVTNNGFNFNRTVVSLMKKATYINIFINEGTKQIAIKKCDESDTDKIRFLRQLTCEYGVRIFCRELQHVIMTMMSWDLEHYNYRIDGLYIDDENSIIFDLAFARRFNKRKKPTNIICDR